MIRSIKMLVLRNVEARRYSTKTYYQRVYYYPCRMQGHCAGIYTINRREIGFVTVNWTQSFGEQRRDDGPGPNLSTGSASPPFGQVVLVISYRFTVRKQSWRHDDATGYLPRETIRSSRCFRNGRGGEKKNITKRRKLINTEHEHAIDEIGQN